MIEVAYTPSFGRQYKKLPLELKEEVREKIEIFKSDPAHPSLKTHKLKGQLRGYYSFSVNYAYRIVFEYDDKQTAVLIFVGDHDVYR